MKIMKIMLVMTNYANKYASTIYQSQSKQGASGEIASERKMAGSPTGL